jgi:hypothetical protein
MAASSGFEENPGCALLDDAPRVYRRIRMAIEIASDSPSFVIVADLLLPPTTAK